MNTLLSFIQVFTCLFGFRQRVNSHAKYQAFGTKWSRHRLRHIDAYTRRRHRPVRT